MGEKRQDLPKIKYYDLSRKRKISGGAFKRPRKYKMKEKVRKQK